MLSGLEKHESFWGDENLEGKTYENLIFDYFHKGLC